MKMMNMTPVLLTALAVVSIACQKADNKSEASGVPAEAKPVEKQEIVVINTTNSPVVKIGDRKYAVLPSPSEIKGISYSNEPLKGTCKAISRAKIELAKLEAQKAPTQEELEQDFSYEGAVDDLALSIEAKKTELIELQQGTFHLVKTTYVKNKQLENLATLKTANPDLSFEIQEPSALTLEAVQGESTKTAQTIAFSKKSDKMVVKSGAFDEKVEAVTLEIQANSEVLCEVRSLNAKVTNKNHAAKLILSFE